MSDSNFAIWPLTACRPYSFTLYCVPCQGKLVRNSRCSFSWRQWKSSNIDPRVETISLTLLSTTIKVKAICSFTEANGPAWLLALLYQKASWYAYVMNIFIPSWYMCGVISLDNGIQLWEGVPPSAEQPQDKMTLWTGWSRWWPPSPPPSGELPSFALGLLADSAACCLMFIFEALGLACPLSCICQDPVSLPYILTNLSHSWHLGTGVEIGELLNVDLGHVSQSGSMLVLQNKFSISIPV